MILINPIEGAPETLDYSSGCPHYSFV